MKHHPSRKIERTVEEPRGACESERTDNKRTPEQPTQPHVKGRGDAQVRAELPIHGFKSCILNTKSYFLICVCFRDENRFIFCIKILYDTVSYCDPTGFRLLQNWSAEDGLNTASALRDEPSEFVQGEKTTRTFIPGVFTQWVHPGSLPDPSLPPDSQKLNLLPLPVPAQVLPASYV